MPLMMNSQSSSNSTLAGPQPRDYSHSSSISSVPSTPGPSSPIIYSANVAPTPNTFSITPPSSSCQNATQSKVLTSLASSPSPVVEMKKSPKESSAVSVRPSPDLIQIATKDELQEMLNIALNENLKLDAACCEARMSAAHHKLHYNLLSIESQEALNRMEVENYMLRREASIFRQNPQDLAQIEYKKILKGYCEYLKEENISLRYRLKKAKRLIKSQDLKLASAHQGIDLLQERIRQNRRHINDMRRPGGPLFHASTIVGRAETPEDCLAHFHHNLTQNTSQLHQVTPEVISEDREKLDALLLAGSILNQENNNISSHQISNTKQLDDQDFQATSHLNSPDLFQNSGVLLPPIQLPLEREKSLQSHSRTLSQLYARRRKSRDSTISVSDPEEPASFHTNENKVSYSDFGINSPCSNNKENSSIKQEKPCNNEQKFYHYQSDTVVTKRGIDDELPLFKIGIKKENATITPFKHSLAFSMKNRLPQICVITYHLDFFRNQV